jgi:hypothetical protein
LKVQVKKISEAILSILYQDDIALLALQRGLLNSSAYARQIKLQVEELTLKDVDEKTIAAELPRLVETLDSNFVLPKIELSSISMHTNLAEVAYEKTEQNLTKIKNLYLQLGPIQKTFITITEGLTEVAIIAEKGIALKFKELLSDIPPIYYGDNFVGVSVKFDLKYIELPQQIVQLVKRLTVKNINIIEVVSTPTEMTFIVEHKNAQLALQQLSG